MIDAGKLARAGCKYLGVSYSTMDCQKFVERCLADSGWKIDLAGSNAWYRKCYFEGWIGSPDECKKQFGSIPQGAFLFIHEFDGGEPKQYQGDGLGNASHIGLYTNLTGDEMVRLAIEFGVKEEVARLANYGNGAIHSSKSRGCVATSKFVGKAISGGWNEIGLLPEKIAYAGVDPTPTPSPDPEPTPSPEPEPKPMTATVWSPNGKHVHLRKRKSKLSAVVDNVPYGAEVEVLEYGKDWCQLAYRDDRGAVWYGYMMTEYLVFEDGNKDSRLFTVTIQHVSYAQAEEIKARYSGALIEEE